MLHLRLGQEHITKQFLTGVRTDCCDNSGCRVVNEHDFSFHISLSKAYLLLIFFELNFT